MAHHQGDQRWISMTACGPAEGLLANDQMRGNIQQSQLGEEGRGRGRGKHQAPPFMDQASPNLGGYCSIAVSTLPSVSELYGADRARRYRWFWFHPYCCPLLNSNSCSFFLGSLFPSLPVSSPCACSKPSLLNCLHVFFKMKGLYKQNPASARLNS